MLGLSEDEGERVVSEDECEDECDGEGERW